MSALPERAPGRPTRLTRRRSLARWIARAALVAAFAFAAAMAAEFAGRRFPSWMPVQWQVERFAIRYPFAVVPDPELGYTMPPNQHEVITTHDYTFLAETDAHGYPNRDPWPDRPQIVFLGDSLLIGAGVGLDASFTHLIARRLPDQPVVNLGLAGAGPDRQARIFRRYAARWSPRLVVSCLFLASDFENDWHFQRWLEDGRGRDYNAFRLQLARDARYRGLFQRILDKSWLLDRGARAAGRWFAGPDPVGVRHRFPDGAEILFERHALEFARTPVTAGDPRLEPFTQSVTRLQALAGETGASLVVMLIPSKEELFEAPAAAASENLAARARERLAAMAVPVLDLYPAMKRGGAAGAPYYSQDIHLNALGNRIVAEEFVAWFEREQAR